MEATQSSGEMRPRTLITQQIWFDTWAGGARDVSHNSRCGKVSGWRQASPLSSHCRKRARFSSDIGGCLEQGFVVAQQPADLFSRKCVKIDLDCRGRELCHWH